MSTVTETITPCPNLQAALTSYFKSCHLMPPPMVLVPFLLSPENSSGIRQLVNPSNGKKRTIQLVYDQQIPVSEVNDVTSCDLVCTATTKRGDLNAEYTIDCTDGKYLEELITLTDWMESCRNNDELVNSRIMSMMNTVAREINQKTAGELNAIIGDWSTDVATLGTINGDGFLELPTKSDGTINPHPYTWQTLDVAKQLTEFCAPTFMLGGLDWYQYMRLIELGCCADTGINLGEVFARYGQAVAFDKDVNTIFGANIGIILQLGSAQLLTLNYAMNNVDVPAFSAIDWAAASNYVSVTLTHPASGIPMDVTLSNACGNISIIVKATTKLVALPNNLYAAGETQEGVNFVTAVQAVNS